MEWIIKNQLGRRNLTEQEASYYRGKLYVSNFAASGCEITFRKFAESRKRQGARTDLTSRNFCEKLTTSKEIGKQYGVSSRTIEYDAQFSQAVDKVAEEIGKEAKEAIYSLGCDIMSPPKSTSEIAKDIGLMLFLQ